MLILINGILIGIVCVIGYAHYSARSLLITTNKVTEDVLDKLSVQNNNLVQAMHVVEAKVQDFQLRLDMRGVK